METHINDPIHSPFYRTKYPVKKETAIQANLGVEVVCYKSSVRIDFKEYGLFLVTIGPDQITVESAPDLSEIDESYNMIIELIQELRYCIRKKSNIMDGEVLNIDLAERAIKKARKLLSRIGGVK